MKKYLALVLGMLFILGFAASAFAIHAEIPSETQAIVAKGDTQITLGGEIRVRGWYTDNVGTVSGSGSITYWNDSDVDGVIDVGESVVGTVPVLYYATGLSPLWLPTNRNYAVSTVLTPRVSVNPGNFGSIYGGSYTTKETYSKSDAWYDTRVRLTIKADVSKNTTGYIALETDPENYTWGNMNAKPSSDLKLLEAWILHTGKGLFGFPAGIKVGHMPLALGERQFLDHTKYGDDAIVFFMDPTKDLHIGLLTAKLAEATTSEAWDDVDGYVGLMTYKIDKDNTIGVNYTYVNRTFADSEVRDLTTSYAPILDNNGGLTFQNLGFHAKGNIAGLSYAAEADFQFGKVFKGTDIESKFRGWGVFANLGYKVNPVNIRAGFAMGSGDSNLSDNKIKEYQVTMGRDVHYAQIYEYTISTTAMSQIVDPKTRNTGIANTTYYRLGLDYDITKDLAISLDGFIIRATKVDPDYGESKNAGWEADAKITYKIDKNLTYNIFAGYFKPGKYYSDTYLDALDLKRKSVVQAWHALTLSF